MVTARLGGHASALRESCPQHLGGERVLPAYLDIVQSAIERRARRVA